MLGRKSSSCIYLRFSCWGFYLRLAKGRLTREEQSEVFNTCIVYAHIGALSHPKWWLELRLQYENEESGLGASGQGGTLYEGDQENYG